MAGAVRRVAGALHRPPRLIVRVSTKAALGDAPVWQAVEGQPHVLQLDHGVDRLLAEHVDGILVGQIIGAFNGVVGVPLPVVLVDVGQRSADTALRRSSVGACGIELGDYGYLRALAGIKCRHEAGAAGPHDNSVKRLCL